MTDAIFRLCAWYDNQCKDDWHEDHGIKIDTLDNPGWSLAIDLEGTGLARRSFEDIKVQRSDTDWLVARRTPATFEAFGGPMNLSEMIETFLSWAR